MRRILALLPAAVALLAQDPAPAPNIKVDVGLVNVAFTARDAHGQLVTDLTRDDIAVFEDGIAQPVQFFGRSADLPLEFALLLDMSGSQEHFNRAHRNDLQAFAKKALAAADKAMLVCFANHVRIASDFTSSAADLLNGLDHFGKASLRAAMVELEPDDTRTAGTALFDAIYYTASLKMMEPGARKALIVFSDGEDNSSARDVIEATEAAQAADALIYTVRFTQLQHGQPTARNRYGVTEMARLAIDTGGLAFDAARTDVGAALSLVSAELRSLYEIGFATTNPARDGAFRKLQIVSKRPGVNIRARRGYYAR